MKTALVTGASRGIGRAIALEFKEKGYSVIGTATSENGASELNDICLLYTSPSPRDATLSRMPSSA